MQFSNYCNIRNYRDDNFLSKKTKKICIIFYTFIILLNNKQGKFANYSKTQGLLNIINKWM